MTRDGIEKYAQDELGNVRRELDELRAQEGMSAEEDSGIVEVTSVDTGSSVLVQSIPTHAQQMIAVQLMAYNSASTDGDTFTLEEASLDGSGNITGTTRRSVPIQVPTGETKTIEYSGESFEESISINSDFSGYVGVAFVSDHNEAHEPAVEQTETS